MPTWSPEDGAAGVPTNAQILLELWSDSLPYFAADNLTVVADGVEDPLAFEITTPVDDGDHVVGVIRFQDELPPDARIDLWLDGGEIPLYGFTTGSGPDLAAPTWDGAYSVDQTALGGSCGRTHRFQVDLDGVAVDDADHALVIAESISGGSWSVVSELDAQFVGFSMGYSEVCGGDPTLLARHVRSYDVTVVDMAGNSTEAFRVWTGCGCAAAPDGDGSLAVLLFGGAVVLRRRRRRAHVSNLVPPRR